MGLHLRRLVQALLSTKKADDNLKYRTHKHSAKTPRTDNIMHRFFCQTF